MMLMASGTILYIEDNLANRELIRRVLEVEGYTIVEAGDGMAGLKAVETVQPDLILMDINLPEMDGYTVTAKLREIPALNSVPIIALTANVMRGDREKTLAAGCDGYIRKPVDIDELPDRIAAFMGGLREREES
jgi:two-component system cell cycle response regulator DivK